MKYNGQELTPITTPQIFDPPKEMLVWDAGYSKPSTANVCAIVDREYLRVITDRCSYTFCAKIPQQKPNRATNLQLMEWIAKGNGMWKRKNDSSVHTHASFFEDSLEKEVEDFILIRPFGTTEGLEPTLENMGMEDK